MLTLARRDSGNFLVLDVGFDLVPPDSVGHVVMLDQLFDPLPPSMVGLKLRDAVIRVADGELVLHHGLVQAKLLGMADLALLNQQLIGDLTHTFPSRPRGPTQLMGLLGLRVFYAAAYGH